MRTRNFSNALVLIAHMLIAGWALLKMLEPGTMLDVLLLFSLC